MTTSHQYKLRQETLTEDLSSLDFDPSVITTKDFKLSYEEFSTDISNFIKRYEWLGTVGVYPKWVFTARYKNILCGVVLFNEPNAYSKVLGVDTPIYEALIQRGACISWSPKGLASRLIMYGCRYLVKNTKKRCFVGYSDSEAGEIGTIYQACNFEFLGSKFGASTLYTHPEFKKGNPFSSQVLRRTSTLRWWAKKHSIIMDKSWLKDNGFKDLSAIPEDIKIQWREWQKNIVLESTSIKQSKKGKYVYVLGRTKIDQKNLNKLKAYTPKPYPKRVSYASLDRE